MKMSMTIRKACQFVLWWVCMSSACVWAQSSGAPAGKGLGHSPGILLEQLSWDEAERVLTPDQVVVIPLGAESKEHGRHLPLNNDWIMAEYFKQRVLASASVVVVPTINSVFIRRFLSIRDRRR